jgi:hypothetical protein
VQFLIDKDGKLNLPRRSFDDGQVYEFRQVITADNQEVARVFLEGPAASYSPNILILALGHIYL